MALPKSPNLVLTRSEFIKSAAEVHQLPETNLPEYAFLGRSNVGKSSLLNLLTARKKLARVSNTPGRTRLLNFFEITVRDKAQGKDADAALVDLPGYGYAKMSKTDKGDMSFMLSAYLDQRKQIKGLFLLLDLRRNPSPEDLEIFHILRDSHIPLHLVFTKADKLPKSKQKLEARRISKLLGDDLEVDYLITSAEKHQGQQQLLGVITR